MIPVHSAGTEHSQKDAPPAPARPGERAETADRFSILIADDDKGTREALAEMLSARGFRVRLAADGGEAVELVQVDLVHLVLFDMHMPRLTGLEAFAVIRQTLDRLLPAVLMTADATNDLIRQAFAAQVYSVIPKPVNGGLVVHTLERALARVYGPRPERPERPEPTDKADPKKPVPAPGEQASAARHGSKPETPS
ncbi:MAG: response regulator [Gemmataceae bacterium]|nr:response regulator [Gemmataceae bacterium]